MHFLNPFTCGYNPFRIDESGNRPFEIMDSVISIILTMPDVNDLNPYVTLSRAIQDGYDHLAGREHSATIPDLGTAYEYGRSIRETIDRFLREPLPDLGAGFASPPDASGWSRRLPKVSDHSIGVTYDARLRDGRRIATIVVFSLGSTEFDGEIRRTITETTTYLEENALDPNKVIEHIGTSVEQFDNIAYPDEFAVRAAMHIHALVDYRPIIPAIDDFVDFVRENDEVFATDENEFDHFDFDGDWLI